MLSHLDPFWAGNLSMKKYLDMQARLKTWVFFGSLPRELGYQVSSVSLQVGLDTACSIFSVLFMTLRAKKIQKQTLCWCVFIRVIQTLLQLLLPLHCCCKERYTEKGGYGKVNEVPEDLFFPSALHPLYQGEQWCSIASGLGLCSQNMMVKRDLGCRGVGALRVGSHLVIEVERWFCQLEVQRGVSWRSHSPTSSG